MSFWVGVVLIVLILEAVRIGLSSYLLLHILRSIERVDDGESNAHSASWYRERDRLASNAMRVLRRSMDELARRGSRPTTQPAVEALDAYILHHQQTPGR